MKTKKTTRTGGHVTCVGCGRIEPKSSTKRVRVVGKFSLLDQSSGRVKTGKSVKLANKSVREQAVNPKVQNRRAGSEWADTETR